jgi:thioredoxin reductase
MNSHPDVVIVGAGPYGLSIAAHLRVHGVSFRIFGSPLSVWRNHMPTGMFLKSDGFASNLSEPESHFTLKYYCEQAGIPYHDTAVPVRLETFSEYADMFQKLKVPTLENQQVTAIERTANGFNVQIDTSEIIETQRVVLAVGISHFPYIPPNLENLRAEFLSHSFRHRDVGHFSGKHVTINGGGASALDLAALLNESGARVTVIARRSSVVFNDNRGSAPRSLLHRMRHPNSGVGPSLKGWFFTTYPQIVHHFPQSVRINIVRRFLGPAAGWTVKERIIDRVPLVLGCRISRAEMQNGGVHLTLQRNDGTVQEHRTEHVIAATGYRADLGKLTFLSEEIRSQLVSDGYSPVLSSDFQSSVPGLYFVGLAAANSFGPVLRFVFGADFAARQTSRHLVKTLRRESLSTAPRPRKSLAGDRLR